MSIKAELQQTIERGDCGYAHPVHPSEAFADFVRARYGCSIRPERAIVVPDVMSGIAESLRVLTAPGDEVITNPTVHRAFFNTIREVGRRMTGVALSRTPTGWSIDLDGVRQTFASSARACLHRNPLNPVCRVLSRHELIAVAKLHALAVASVFPLRRRPRHDPSYLVAGYPAVPALFVVAALFLLVNALPDKTTHRPTIPVLGVTLAGIPVYRFIRAKRAMSSVAARPTGA